MTYDNKKNNDNDIHYRLIANHEHLKNRNRVYKTDYLQLYIEKKFQCDKSTTKNLINFIENFINNINITDFIVEDILNETIKDIENGSIH
jgi:hypothetical protein